MVAPRPIFGGPKRPTIGVVVYPGSNCDHDTVKALTRTFGLRTRLFWHTEATIDGVDGIVIPGGFSFGDYLRSGALAARSPVTQAVVDFCRKGGPVLGICNGFQVLTEAGLLPGALLPNKSGKFICRHVHLVPGAGSASYHRVARDRGDTSPPTLVLPIAHGEGRYHLDRSGLLELEQNGRIAFQYATPKGEVMESANPNGSTASIAGVISASGRVMGMMPHPERALDPTLSGGSTDGLVVWEGFFASFL